MTVPLCASVDQMEKGLFCLLVGIFRMVIVICVLLYSLLALTPLHIRNRVVCETNHCPVSGLGYSA